jgi:hypothetical protein
MFAGLSDALQLQEQLMTELAKGIEANPASFATVRTLMAATTERDTFSRLRLPLACQEPMPTDGRLQFEHARIPTRIAWMELVARWTAHSPDGFIEAARAAGLTRQRFARQRIPSGLADVLRALPTGNSRRRAQWTTILNDTAMRQLRGSDKKAWRALRARRILAGKPLPPEEVA